MMIHVQCKFEEYLDHINYVLGFLNEHPLLPEGNVFLLNSKDIPAHINYGDIDFSGYVIPAQHLIFKKTVVQNSDLFCNAYSSKSDKLFSIESTNKKTTPFIDHRIFGFDILETIFFHISRYEEYHCPSSDKDEWDMMWEEQQILVRERLYHTPVIDHLVFAFFEHLGLKPTQRKTTFCLSHDIDVIEKFKTPMRILRSCGRTLLDNGVIGFVNHLKDVVAVKRNRHKDPYDTFEFLLIDSSINHFEEKILYLMAGGRTTKDNYYQINDKKITSVITKAKALGYQIGLHGSYATDKDGIQFKKEMAHLAKATSQSVVHNRQHFLHFDFQHTPKILEDAGIEIDSSLGYQHLIGFRSGTGFRYRLFDFDTKMGFSWKEQAMVIMDGALLNESGEDIQKASFLLDQFVKQNLWNTQITLNVHNTIFDPSKRDVAKMEELYKQMISMSVFL